ncbi:MAG: hypothetical protein H6Q60_256 [Oscillospiraceae bacterium]|nr:hypothetical protein [Oscillospiraceae bacterium]
MAKVDLSIKSILTRFSVLFIYLLNVESSLVNSALADIKKTFPDVDPSTISLISTIPSLSSIVVALFVMPFLIKRYNKKSIVITALVIYSIGGMAGFLFNTTVTQLLAGRFLVGIGMGLSAPLCAGIINELYVGMEKTNMLGWSNAVDSCMGILLTMVAGILCAMNWRYTFLAYGIFLIILVMEIFFLPSLPAPVAEGQSGNKESVKVVYTPKQMIKLICVLLFAFCFLMFAKTVMVKTSILVSEQNLGSAVITSTAMSTLMFGMIATGFIFGIVERVIKRYTIVLAAAVMAVGAFMMSASNSVSMLMAASFVVGIGNGLVQPSLMTKALAIGPRTNGSFATSMVIGLMGIGSFLAAYTEKFFGLFTDPTAVHLMHAVGVTFTVITVITLIYVVWNPLKGVNHAENDQAPSISNG